MKSSDGGATRLNRWFSSSTDGSTDQDPWMDFAQATDDAGEVKMAFDDDFHLTVIPNFLHDSDAYIANLEDRLERLQQVNPNPSPREILATMTEARTLRAKNAELNSEQNAKPPDDTGDEDDAGFMTMWPALFALVSRRFFPRLALTKEETQHLLKYDQLLAQYQDEINNNDIRNDEAEGCEIRDVETVPDTSWERRDKDSSSEQLPSVENPEHELSYLRFDSPEAHDIQIPKNWVCDESHREIQQDTTPMPEYSTNECPKVNRSALSLSANANAIIQEASTVTSFTPTKRSEDAFYNFAYIKTSMTTQDSVRVGTPAVYPSSVGNADSHSKSKIASQDKISLTAAACNVNMSENQYDSSVPFSDEKEAKAVSKSSGNVSDVITKEETILTTKSSPSLKPTRDTELKDMSLTEGDKDEVPQDMGEDKGRGQSASIKSQTQLPTAEDELHGSNRSSSSQMVASKDSSVPCKALQDMIVPDVTIASSSTQESIVVQQPQCDREEDKKAPVRTGHSIHGPDITVPEVMVASSSTRESMAAGFEGPWFDKESDMSLGNTGEDLLQHMSSLVRASVDEYDEPPTRVSANQTSQLSGGCTQLSSTGVCSDRTRSKASEGTSGNYTTNYSDPHSNLFEDESNIKKGEGQAPIIRMYGHVALQGNLRFWPPQQGGSDSSRGSHEVVSPRLLPLPQAKRNVAEKISAVTCEDKLRNTKKEDEKKMSATPWQHTKTKGNQHSEESQTAVTALKVSVISDTECRKVPSAKSEYWSSRSRSSASSVASSVATSTKSATEEAPTKAAVSKFSTSLTFKNRQRSVHWFEAVEDVDSDTVVRDCDYLSTSQMKMKAPAEDVTGRFVKAKDVASKKESKSDHSEGSRVTEGCKFTAHVLEEEGIVASKVYSFPEFFETSCGKEQGTTRAAKDIVIITKDDEKSANFESVEPSETFEAQSEAASVLMAQKDLTAASESDDNAAIYTARCSESFEGQDVKANVPRIKEGLAAAENDGVNSVVDSARLSASLEGPLSKDSPIASQEHLRNTAQTKMQAADEPEMRVVSCSEFTAVLNGEQSGETVRTKQESFITNKACQEQGVPLKSVDKETQVRLDGGSEKTNEMQSRTNSPYICQRCSPQSALTHEEKPTRSTATENEYGQSSSNVYCGGKDCNEKKSLKSKKEKQEPTEGQGTTNDDESFSKDTTVLQCHELVTASHFARFPAANRNSAPIQRSLNITRTLRITTTNQFKPLNLRHSITGVLNNSSSFIGRPLSIQSREVVPPRTLPQQHHDRGQKALNGNEGSTACLEPVRSSSCKDVVEATNTVPLATGQPLAHKSHSYHSAVSKGTEGLKKVTSENPAHESTQQTGNDRHSDTAPEGAADSEVTPVDDSLNHEQRNASSTQDEKVAAADGCKEVQLPLKKRMCCRLAQGSKILDSQGTPNNDSTSSEPLQMRDAKHRMAEAAGIAKDMETVDCDEAIARLDAELEAALKKLDIDKDNVFLNEEHPIQGAQVDRTISLVAESHYSTVGAAEISHASPISTILGGDMNVETAKISASLPSASDCAISTASKDDTLLKESLTVATMPPEEVVLTANDVMSASIDPKCLTKPAGKPTPQKRQKRGGEKDADAEDDGSWTDLLVLSEDATDQDEPSKPLSQLGTNGTPDDQCLAGGSLDT